ncbi:MAG: B12-binding domain-containing radical SAM protein [Candidatus Riflebacteria bacterium]|nr:B12-binding domain-containing radical SAM protein [Candidatus Riflebacteria bacterium]
MTRPDILLIAPPLLWENEARPEMKQPLNLLYLASWLNRQGLRAKVLDAVSAQLSLSDILLSVGEVRPRFIGVPFYQATRETALQLFSAIRGRFPEIWLIAGGPLVTTSTESLLRLPEIDICVTGEGEVTLEELLRSGLSIPRTEDADRSCLATISGLGYVDHKKSVITPPRPSITDLDSIPFVDFDLIDIQRYFAYHASIEMSNWLFLTTSRGCNARCTFCATPVLWPDGMRRQSVPRLLAEIVHQRQLYPSAQFGFMDDSFFSDKAWLREFFDGISSLNVKYCCIGRADHLCEEDVRGLAQSGCIYVALGIETGNQARQRTIRKHLDLDRVRASIRLLAEYDIFSKGFFMLGFPDETPEEMLETINFAVELKKLGMGECNFFPVSIYPGTELAERCAKSACVSTVYKKSSKSGLPESPSQSDKSDIAENKLLRYANIPDADVNAFFKASQILNIVKFGYRQVESGKFARLEELMKTAEFGQGQKEVL